MPRNLRVVSAIIISILLINACESDKLISDSSAKLELSIDTLFFDTIFTTIGSTTKRFTVRNPHDGIVKVSSIELAGAPNSPFRIGVDGPGGTLAVDKEILPGDSIYIFVEVTLDPNNDNLPLVIKDSVVFKTNGNIQDVKLMAWGQDVHLYKSDNWTTLIETETWVNDKPYLIYGNVWVKRDHVLTLEPGVRIHLHKYSSLVAEGRIISNGTFEEPVIIQGDRLEELYKNLPGQWGTIALLPPSTGNIFNFTEVYNGSAGFQIGDGTNDTIVDVVLNNVTIGNLSSRGILAFGAKIDAYNLLVYNAQWSALELVKGGRYRFYHASLSDNSVSYVYGSKPQVILANNLIDFPTWDEDLGKYVEKDYFNDLDAYFANSIIWGGLQNELLLSEDEQNAFAYKFENCIIKAIEDSLDTGNAELFLNTKFNANPKFIDPAEDDYQLDTLSPAKDSGNIEIVNLFPSKLTLDLNNENRTLDLGPDMGAFERIE